MIENYAKIIQVIADANGIVGRKKLQKMIYIAKKLDIPFEEKFSFHFYGPYSEELTVRIDELCDLGYLQETKEDKGNFYQYRYEVTTEGNELLQEQESDLLTCTNLVLQLNGESSRFLELVSTVMFFDELSKEEVIEKIFTLKAKQNYSVEEINQAYQYIDSLKKGVQ